MLIRHLPPESATKTAIRNATDPGELKQMSETADPSKGQWSQIEMLLALLVDSVRQQTYAMVRLQAGSKAGKAPDPVPRPGIPPKGRRARKTLSPEKAEFLFRWINGPDAE